MREALSGALWLNLVMVLLAMSITAVPVMAPAIAQDLGLSTKLVGTYTALMWTASVVTSVAVSRMVARYGALRVSQVGLALCASGLLLGASGPVIFLAAAAILIGLSQGLETPSSSALLVRITRPEDRPFVFSLKQTGGQIGGMLAGLVLPLLLPWIGWRGALLSMVPLLLVLALFLERPRRRYAAQFAHSGSGRAVTFTAALAMVMRSDPLRRLAIVCMTYVAAQVALIAFLVSYLVTECGLSLVQAGALMAVSQVGGLIGRIAWGWMCSRAFSAVAVLAFIGAGMLVSSAVLGLFGDRLSMPGLALVCFLFGMTAGGWAGIHIAETARLVPVEAVTPVTGAVLVIGCAGLVLGPMAFAALAGATSYGTAYVGAAACALAGLLALVVRPLAAREA